MTKKTKLVPADHAAPMEVVSVQDATALEEGLNGALNAAGLLYDLLEEFLPLANAKKWEEMWAAFATFSAQLRKSQGETSYVILTDTTETEKISWLLVQLHANIGKAFKGFHGHDA